MATELLKVLGAAATLNCERYIALAAYVRVGTSEYLMRTYWT